MDPNNVKTTHSCLPVTALQVLPLQDSSLILSGQGSFLSVTEPESSTLLACQRAFASSVVHGIACDSSWEPKQISRSDLSRSGSQHLTWFARILVWGGSSLCFARFRILSDGFATTNPGVAIEAFEIGPTVKVHDWILNGSLVCDISSSEAEACLITAHNELVLLPFPRMQDSPLNMGSPSRIANIRRVTTSAKPFLYSARVQFQPPGTLGVLGGTAFGEICTWNSQAPHKSSRLIESKTGHHGITFGVDQCGDWLATCSDDRGVRLGGLGDNAPLVEKWRHMSRVWEVKFMRTSTGALCLVSVGEDNCCKVQQIAQDGLIKLVDDRYHSGKNIWSLTVAHIRVPRVITGGADGGIVSRDVFLNAAPSSRRAAGSHFDHGHQDFTSLVGELEMQADSEKGGPAKTPSVRQYQFTSHRSLLALTDSGHLYSISKPERAYVDNKQSSKDGGTRAPAEVPVFLKWSIQRKCRNQFGPRAVLSDSEDHLVFIGNDSGQLFVCVPADDDRAVRFVTQLDIAVSWLAIAAIRQASNRHRECCVVVYSRREGAARVVVARLPTEAEELAATHASEMPPEPLTSNAPTSDEAPAYQKVWNLDLPEDFVPTSARLLNRTMVLVLGSRRSVLAIYRPLSESDELSSVSVKSLYAQPMLVSRVHESDSVTSIRSILAPDGAAGCKKEHFLTTGRNGTCAVHAVSLDGGTVAYEILDKTTTSSFSSGIEGCHCVPAQESKPGVGASSWISCGGGEDGTESDGQVQMGDLVLYGFDSERFVVWNESRQSLIFSVECGNLHRAWAYNKYWLAGLPNRGAFAWTQAGFFHLVDIHRPGHQVIQQGGHGREIKALSVSPLLYRDDRHGIPGGRLVATGAEDTTIRFFAVGPNVRADSRNQLILLRTVKKHNTGIQCLSFSSCGRYLFSSGGCEELFAWRIRHDIPGVNLGVVLSHVFPEDTADSDLRITDFHVQDSSAGTFVVSVAYSNSLIKVFHFSPAESDPIQKCQLRNRFFYQDNCLTQIHDDLDAGMLTASTDGHLVCWPVRTPGSHNPKYVHRLHQNSIQAMRRIELPFRGAGRHEQLVITGGDDNALGLTLLRLSAHDPGFQSLRIPNAHAAAITAVCLLAMSQSGQTVTIRFLSASNDQRVKLWEICIAGDQLGRDGEHIGGSQDMAAVGVALLASTATNVADVAAMELLCSVKGGAGLGHSDDRRLIRDHSMSKLPPEVDDAAQVMIVGVGMEVLDVPAERVSFK